MNPIRKEPSKWFAREFPCTKVEVAEAVTEVTANELLGQRMRPGDVRQRG
jgi:hypothetical protein